MTRGTNAVADGLRNLIFTVIVGIPGMPPGITQVIVDKLIDDMIKFNQVEVIHIADNDTLNMVANGLATNQSAIPALLDALPDFQWHPPTYTGVPNVVPAEDFNATRTHAVAGTMDGQKALSNLVKLIRRLER